MKQYKKNTMNISPWTKEAVEWMQLNEIATDFNDPQAPVNKETMAVILKRLHDKITK